MPLDEPPDQCRLPMPASPATRATRPPAAVPASTPFQRRVKACQLSLPANQHAAEGPEGTERYRLLAHQLTFVCRSGTGVAAADTAGPAASTCDGPSPPAGIVQSSPGA